MAAQTISSPKHSVIVAHPEPDSFTMSVAKAYCEAVAAEGQHVVMRDLYRMGFDPVLKGIGRPQPDRDVAAELDQIAGTELFVLVYPVWFGAPPAMLKGYIDRIFGAGFTAPRLGAHLLRPTHPLLGGKRLLSFSSSGSTQHWLEEQGAWSSLQTLFDGYLARTFWMESPEHVHFESIVEGLEADVVARHLAAVADRARRMCGVLRRVAA